MKRIILFLLIAGYSCKTPSPTELTFKPYYINQAGYNNLIAFDHFIFISNIQIPLSDSSLTTFASEYTRGLRENIPVASIIFISDTTFFPKDYDEQHWDKIRLSFYRDITFDFRPGIDSSKTKEIGYWSNGKRIKSRPLPFRSL